ncbi:ATP-binding protein [Streptomyces sp. NPDC048641]|uniref:ATP-binding protein n=1 Tax=unclassified Streptomyces TaxID=2593676 RepID=UPI0034268EA8
MNEHSGVAVLPRHPRAAAEARQVLEQTVPANCGETDMAALLLTEVVSNAIRHAKGAAIEVSVDFDRSAGVITGAVFDTEPLMGAGARSSSDHTDAEVTDMETGRGLDLLDTVAGAWGVATAGCRGKWVWFQVHAA